MPNNFTKPVKTLDQLVNILENRGMTINNRNDAITKLGQINYLITNEI